MSSVQDPKEICSVINRGLPNISTYIKVILKREKLSEEAESMRARYENLLTSLETGNNVPHRPVSIICDDDSGYFSGNRHPRVSELSEQPKGLPGITHSGYLLRRDDKYRWHRSWCKADSREMKLFIYEDLNEEFLIRSFSLEGVTTRFGPHPVPDSDKENSFAVSGIGVAIEPLNLPTASENGNGLASPAPPPTSSSTATDEAYFAAYSEGDYKQWKEVLHVLTGSRESSRLSLSFLDNAPWLGAAHDSISTSSSSFGSNRESMISTTSSLLNNRMSTRIETGEVVKNDSVDDATKRLSSMKQQQPLPLPPNILPPSQPENVPLPDDDDDNASEDTIYESIDNLVSQFDDAIRATAAAMGQIGQSMKSGGKKRKKKHNLLSKQTSFLARPKSHKPNFLSEKKHELERGDKYSGYLFKKTSGGAWKKRWCTLKGCVFGYFKAAEDTHGREYVVLDAEVNKVNDPKRSFAFSLKCRGVEEMFFAGEDDDLSGIWMARLSNASRNHGEYSEAWSGWQSEENLAGSKAGEGIYSVPNSLPLDQGVLVPRPATTMTSEMAIDTGIYSVPRFLLEQPTPMAGTPTNPPLGNGSDIYDVPRASLSPDEEGIYDDPYDILGDMEIYDYPPDVNDLPRFLEDSGFGTTEHSTRTSTITVATDGTSSTISEDSLRAMTLPPIPSGPRPLSVISSDEHQSNRNSVASLEGAYTFPRTQPQVDLHSIFERPTSTGPPVHNTDLIPEQPDSSSLEFGQCIIRGHLYKKERLLWTKLYSIIRNNFLECHKSQGGGYVPALKLFLPGSEIKPGGGDSKRRHAIQVKHPRRDGVLVFATETPEEYPQWMKAFQSGASIQVQAVSTVEEMRITDLEMQKRWTNGESKDSLNESEGWNGTLPRRKTFSNGTQGSEDYSSDTLKRRRRFTLGKLTKKKDKKMTGHLSTPELKRSAPPPPPVLTEQENPRRSASCEELPMEQGATIESHQITGPNGVLKFQGFLCVHRYGANTNFIRYWCVFDGSVVSCYISQLDLTLAMSVGISGSQISEASTEAGRPHTFKVWHMETGQCIFFSALNNREYSMWFAVVTQNAEQTPTPHQPGAKTIFFIVPGLELKMRSFHARQRSNSLPTSPAEEAATGDTVSTVSGHGSSDSPATTFYRGYLKKASNSNSGKWKERYCVVKDGHLSLFHTPADKSAITSIDLAGCSIELVSVSRSSVYKLVFKVNTVSGEKTHTFAAPSETEMYAWVSALRDSSFESQTRSQTELSTGGSNNSSPALPNKSTLRKRGSKAKFPGADLVSYVPANTLTNPDISGFADIQVGTDLWSRFWCVVHSDCLYIYQNQQSQATVKTVVLPGYDIHVADPLIYKRQFAILLSHSGIAPVVVAVNDESELNQWLTALDNGTRAEGLNSKTAKRVSKSDEGKMVSGSKGAKSGAAKKGPVRADHSIKDGGSVDSIPSAMKNSEAHQDSIIRRYEKRIRKTHRVANQTEQKLKEHQTALLHFKKELSRHLKKLKDLADSGEANAQRRLDDVGKKLAQVDKILPYLIKYVSVNRQAEMQTVLVLKESCTVEIQKMARDSLTLPDTSTPKQKGVRASRDFTDKPEQEPSKEENPYASLTDILPEVQAIKAKSNYAQLDFSQPSSPGGAGRPPTVNYAEVQISRVPSPAGAPRSPTVNYAEVQIGSNGKPGVIMNSSVPAPSIATHTNTATALVDESMAPIESINEGDNSQDTTLTPENASTLSLHNLEPVQETTNTRSVSPNYPAPTTPAPPPPTEPAPPVPVPPAESSELSVVPTPSTEPVTNKRVSSLEAPFQSNTESSPTHKAPPMVAKKPSRTTSRINGHRNSLSSDGEREHTSPAREDASSVLSTAPSITDRIKTLHKNP